MKKIVDTKAVISFLRCPCCSSFLEIKGNNVQCKMCKCVFSKKNGLVDFVLEEEKMGELYKFYDDLYLIKNPGLDCGDAGWKAQLIFSLIPRGKRKEPLRVLDIGCGSGEVLSKLSCILPISLGIGVDLSAGHLCFAQQRNPQFNYFQSSATHLPFADSSFDIGIMVDLLEHIVDIEPVLTEAKRVCKTLLIKVPLENCLEGWMLRRIIPDFKDRFGHIQAFNLESIRELLRQDGRVIRQELLDYTPSELIGWQNLPLRARFFYKLRLLFRKIGKNFYRRICPLWYVALVE